MSEPVITIEAGGLPSDWQTAPFDRCVLEGGIERKASIQQGDYRPIGRFPIVDQGNSLIAGYTENENLAHREDLPLILFGDHTRVFKFLDFPFATGADGTKLFRPNEELVEPKFLYYALLHLDIPSRGYNRHFKYLKEKAIPVPDRRDEQRAIAAVLSKIQKAGEVQENIIATLKELKAATMAKLFREGLRTEPLKQTEIGEIPESWQVVRLGGITDLITKGSSPNWQGFEYCDNGVMFIRSQNVGLGELLLSEVVYLPEKFNLKERRSVLSTGDLLINIVGASIGRAAVADERLTRANINQAVALVRFSTNYNPFFFMHFLTTVAGLTQMHRQKKEIARANLSLEDVGSFLVPLPQREEQDEIAGLLETLGKRIRVAEQRRDNLKRLFSSMLHLLMTGQVRVNGLWSAVANNSEKGECNVLY